MTNEVASWRRELAARWAVLRDRPATRGVLTSELPLTTADGAVLVGIDLSGDRHLLVPITRGTEVAEDTRAAHVRVQRREVVFDGVTGLYVDVSCHRADLAALFDDVLAEILARLSATPTRRPDVVCVGVLDAWRELLRRRSGRLSEQAMRGLFGELIVLEHVLAANSGQGIEAWSGPDRTPHDFRLVRGDLEVKTLGVTGSEVEIHGIEQLEPPPGGDLHLVLVRLAAAREGRCLPELVERIRTLAADQAALADRLSAAGYTDESAEEYRETRFTVSQMVALRVDEIFPKLTRACLIERLPDQITALTYTLDLSALLANAIAGPALEQVLRRGGS